MKAAIAFLLAWTISSSAGADAALDQPAFHFDPAKSKEYLDQRLALQSSGAAVALRQQLSLCVDEILNGPWLPLYSDYSAGEAGGVGLAEWCFDTPGEYLVAISQAAPLLTDVQKTNAHHFLAELIRTAPPTRQLHVPWTEGKPRSVRRTPPLAFRSVKQDEAERLGFEQAYGIWLYASSFDAWDEAKLLFADLVRLRDALEARDEFNPHYKPEHGGVLSTADLQDLGYRFTVYRALLAGYHDDYGYHGAREAQARMEKSKPVFFYCKLLSALIGHYRLAQHWSNHEEMQWAERTFQRVATRTLQDRSAPFLWSDPNLSPEVARLLRDAAGSWLRTLAKSSNVALMAATDWDNRPVPGHGDYQVMDPYTWFHAWGGQGEGVRPRTVLGAFLVNAYLFQRSPEEVAQTLDIPWCKADLYYLSKLAVAIGLAEGAGWAPVSQ